MGADIYLRSVSDKTRAEWEVKFNEAVKARDAHYAGVRTVLAAYIPDGVKPPVGCVVITKDDPWQKAVEEAHAAMYSAGYYRDPYNPSGLFQLLGISWWRDVTPMLRKRDRCLPIRQAKKLKQMIEAKAPITDAMVRAYLREHRKDFGKSTRDVAGWGERWRKDYADLIALLDQSIELNEPLDCSL